MICRFPFKLLMAEKLPFILDNQKEIKMKKTVSALALSLISLFAANSYAADIEVENFAGKQTVPHNPKRVVVLDFAALDTLRELGVKEYVIGTSKGKIPPYLSEFADEQKYPNMGTMPEPAFEKINEANPDLIIASTRQKKTLPRLKEIAPVLYLDTDYSNQYPSFQANVLALGKVFDKEALAKEKLDVLDKRLGLLAEQIKGKNALITIVNESKISAFGDKSRYALVYQKFGFTPVDTNLGSSTHGHSIGFEYLAEKNPDYILVIDRTAAVTDKANNAKQVLDNAIVNKTQAAQNNQIIYLDSVNWYLAFGGLQSMNAMIDEVQSAVKK